MGWSEVCECGLFKSYSLFSIVLLLIYCLLLLPLFVEVLCLVLLLLIGTWCPYSFAIILMGKRERWLHYFNCLPYVL